MRQAIARMLELDGYTVRQAPDARRGLEGLAVSGAGLAGRW